MNRQSEPNRMVEAVLEGDRRALARVISVVENGSPHAAAVLAGVFPHTGAGYRVGLTGAPGSGKSTLVDQLIPRVRAGGHQVAVLAVDPSSPFSGGAVLGDRVRMQDHVSDPGVYVRSMASRGHLGGLSGATPKALTILDAAGFPYLLIETVGVGQDEVEIVEVADTTVVVVNPGWGDSIQAAKAGLLEIADVFVVNKADRPGTEEAVADLKQMLALGEDRPWDPPIVTTVAVSGEGIDQAWDAVLTHRRYLEESGTLGERRRRRLTKELEAALMDALRRRARDAAGGERFAEITADVADRKLDPWSGAELLLDGG
ncbi:MAG: methylmalonyl Co-A mutase-associated GTPase MeaB [Acidimicrobiia bacterium]